MLLGSLVLFSFAVVHAPQSTCYSRVACSFPAAAKPQDSNYFHTAPWPPLPALPCHKPLPEPPAGSPQPLPPAGASSSSASSSAAEEQLARLRAVEEELGKGLRALEDEVRTARAALERVQPNRILEQQAQQVAADIKVGGGRLCSSAVSPVVVCFALHSMLSTRRRSYDFGA